MSLYDEPSVPLGVVPLAGRGSLPFALLHGESLVAVASWALGEAGVQLVDFTVSWDQLLAHVAESGAPVVVHDPLCPGTPVTFLREAVEVARSGVVVVGVRPVTDTVREVVEGGMLGETVDRATVSAVVSPLVVPATALPALATGPGDLADLADLADLVVTLGRSHEVRRLEAPPQARRIGDESDLRLLEALLDPR